MRIMHSNVAYPIDDQETWKSVSFKIESDVHIKFCDDDYASCYTAILSGFNNTKSIIQKCARRLKYSDDTSCNMSRVEKKHSSVSS